MKIQEKVGMTSKYLSEGRGEGRDVLYASNKIYSAPENDD